MPDRTTQPIDRDEGTKNQRFKGLWVVSGMLLWSGTAMAQTEAPAAPTEVAEVPEAATLVPADPPASNLTIALAADAPPPAPVAEDKALAEPTPEPAVTAPKPAFPSFKIGMGVRTGLSASLSNPTDRVGLTLDDGLVDQVNVRPYLSGQLTENIGAVANFEIGTPKGLGSFAILDAILQFKIADEFQVWVGQHIPANDRTNFCGPFYHNSWNFAIAVQSYPFDVGARDRGVTFWGLIADGVIKYHLSMVDLQKGRAAADARYGARVTLNLLDPENYYYASGTYYGSQDTLAIGAVVQYQDGIAGPLATTDVDMDGEIDNDFLGFSFDLLFEKRLGTAGTVTLEGGYWNFEQSGKDYVVNQGSVDTGLGVTGPQPGSSMLGAISWLTPTKIGIGHIQPNARYQFGNYDAGDVKVLDAGVAYIVDGFNNRWHVNYRNVDTSAVEHIVQVGAQMQL